MLTSPGPATSHYLLLTTHLYTSSFAAHLPPSLPRVWLDPHWEGPGWTEALKQDLESSTAYFLVCFHLFTHFIATLALNHLIVHHNHNQVLFYAHVIYYSSYYYSRSTVCLYEQPTERVMPRV